MFESNAKTGKSINELHLRSMIEFWWNSCSTVIHWGGWDSESEFFTMTKAHFCSSPNSVVGIQRTIKIQERSGNGGYKFVKHDDSHMLFDSKEQFEEFYFNKWKKEYSENCYCFHIEGLSTGAQHILNKTVYIASSHILPYPGEIPEITDGGFYKDQIRFEWKDYLVFLNELIF